MPGTISMGASALGAEALRRALIPAAAVAVACGACPAGAVAQGSREADRAVLEALYDATDGPNWTDSTNWKTNAPLEQWHGVTMHEERVWGVNLHDNALRGSIPSELGSLTNVRWLILSSNALTGSIPSELGNLVNLDTLFLSSNALTGGIPRELGNLVNLKRLWLSWNELAGAIPSELGSLVNLEELHLSSNELTGSTTWLENLTNLKLLNLFENWGVAGSLPASLKHPSLETLDIFFTQTCAPAVWRDWLKTIEFNGGLCGGSGSVTIDVAVVYTRAARETAGGTAAIEALVDLWIAETNGANHASGVRHRLALVAREEVSYVETGEAAVDIERLRDPSDGHLDGVHHLRDRTAADLVHLIVGESDTGGRGDRPGAFSVCIVTYPTSGCFAHELGHNMALRHDRYEQSFKRDWGGGVLTSDPAYGYVNQRAFRADAPESSRWRTIMAYNTQCEDADFQCSPLLRFANPRQQYDGVPLGVRYEAGGSGVDGPADAVAVLNRTGPAIALWRDRPAAVNRPPVTAGVLPPLRIGLNETSATVDVSGAFRDPDGDPLTYGATSSAVQVAAVSVSGGRVMVTPVSAGAATIRVTATDPGGLSAAQTFVVTVGGMPRAFTDHPIVADVTPIKAIHFTELRDRIDALRAEAGLSLFAWTDPVVTAGLTAVKLVHLLELRSALAAAYSAAGRVAPRWTDAAPAGGTTPIRAAHLMELRAAVIALE